MPEPDDWAEIMDLDTTGDVHVTKNSEGVYLFYTEDVDEFIRTDYVIDTPNHR